MEIQVNFWRLSQGGIKLFQSAGGLICCSLDAFFFNYLINLGDSDLSCTPQSSAHGLSCSTVPGILVPWPGMDPPFPVPQGRFVTPGPPGKSPLDDFWQSWWERERQRETERKIVCPKVERDIPWISVFIVYFSSWLTTFLHNPTHFYHSQWPKNSGN